MLGPLPRALSSPLWNMSVLPYFGKAFSIPLTPLSHFLPIIFKTHNRCPTLWMDPKSSGKAFTLLPALLSIPWCFLFPVKTLNGPCTRFFRSTNRFSFNGRVMSKLPTCQLIDMWLENFSYRRIVFAQTINLFNQSVMIHGIYKFRIGLSISSSGIRIALLKGWGKLSMLDVVFGLWHK